MVNLKKIREKYKKSIYLFIGFIIGFLGYAPFLSGISFLRLAFFLVPIVIFSWSMTGSKKRFNLSLFAIILFFIVLFSSNFMVFQSDYFDGGGGGGSVGGSDGSLGTPYIEINEGNPATSNNLLNISLECNNADKYRIKQTNINQKPSFSTYDFWRDYETDITFRADTPANKGYIYIWVQFKGGEDGTEASSIASDIIQYDESYGDGDADDGFGGGGGTVEDDDSSSNAQDDGNYGPPKLIINGGNTTTNSLQLELTIKCEGAVEMRLAQYDTWTHRPDMNAMGIGWISYQESYSVVVDRPEKSLTGMDIYIFVEFKKDGVILWNTAHIKYVEPDYSAEVPDEVVEELVPEGPMNLEAFNMSKILQYIEMMFGIIFLFLLFIVPILLIAGGIYAIISGSISEGVNAIVKVLIVFFFIIMAIFLFDLIGIEIPGISDGVVNAIKGFVGMIENIYRGLNTIDIFNIIPDLPNIPEFSAGSSSTMFEFYTENPRSFIYTVSATLPMFISTICLFFSILFLSKKIRGRTIEFFDEFSPKDEIADDEPHYFNFNYYMGFYAIIIILGAWFMYLNYTKAFRETGAIANWGKLSIYMFMIIFPLIILSLPKITIYTRSNLKNTLKGFIIGMGILYFSLMFVCGSDQTLSAYSYAYSDTTWYQIFNTFIFVAPAESLFFHIFIPALFQGWLYNRARKNLTEMSGIAVEQEIIKNKGMIETYERLMDVVDSKKEKTKLMKEINELKDEINELEPSISLSKQRFLFEELNVYFPFLLIVLLTNFFFSISHQVLSGVDFFQFWLSGLGFVYLVGGIIMTITSWKYGWFSGILVHAVYNSISIMMVVFYSI